MAERRPHVAPHYRARGALRRQFPALTRGAMRWLRNSDEQRVLSYARSQPAESLVVAVNPSAREFAGNVDVGPGAWQDVTPDGTRSRPGRAGPLQAVFPGPWEFREFSRVTP